jgi:hypothetical protein
MSAKIAITWKAFGDRPEVNRYVSTVEFEADFEITAENLDTFLEVVYAQTNTYRGNFWNIIEPLLSPTRTHTALSVGDEIAIDDKTYKVADCGFTLIEKAVA